MMKISQLTFRDALKLVEQRRNLVCGINDDIMMRMHGRDLGDHYFIIEDRRDSDKNGHADSYFLFYLDESDTPFEVKKCPTMIEAMLHYAQRFTLENRDGADSSNPEISERHDSYQSALRNLIE
jgi:hypothetical protein